MKNTAEKDIKQHRIPSQPPLHDFYMPAMPPTELVTAIARWVRKHYRRVQKRR